MLITSTTSVEIAIKPKTIQRTLVVNETNRPDPILLRPVAEYIYSQVIISSPPK